MRYLIFTNTPAHVHLYRNVVPRLRDLGHEVLLLARDYGCSTALLEYFDLPYELYGRQGASFRSLVQNVPGQFARIFRRAREYDPDVVFGRGVYAAFAGQVTGTQTVLVLDSEPSHLGHTVSSRFADSVFTPTAFDGRLGDRHYTFDSLKECAYLHPDNYSPDPSVRSALGVATDEPYVIVRFNAFDSLHDVGLGGTSDDYRRTLLAHLAKRTTVFVSDEGRTLPMESLPARRFDVHPGLMHDALAEADLLVADTGTIASEAALLGTPTIRFVDPDEPEMGEFRELERNGLLSQFTDVETVLETADGILGDPAASDRWAEKRDRYMASKPNLAELLVDVAERPYDPESVVSRHATLQPA